MEELLSEFYGLITIDYQAEVDQREQYLNILETYGVCVVKDYLSPDQCDEYAVEAVENLVVIEPELDPNDPESWTMARIPLGPQWGMYQSIVGNFDVAWKLREKCFPLFRELYDTEELLTSVDGASIYPYREGKPAEDWAHVDSPDPDDLCYQGQIVLTDTTASFRCTPYSHTIMNQLIDVGLVKTDRRFNMFPTKRINEIIDMLPHPELYQIPIITTKGSFILWKSQTIHSGRKQDVLLEDDGSPYVNWRIVFYICMMPKFKYSEEQKQNIETCVTNGRMTNHTNSEIFTMRGRSYVYKKKTQNIRDALNQPERFVKQALILASPTLSQITHQINNI